MWSDMPEQHVYVTSTDTTNPWEVKSSSVRPKKDHRTRGRLIRKNTKNSDKFDKRAFEKYVERIGIRDDWWSSKRLDFYDSSAEEAAGMAAAPLFAQAFWHELMGEVDKQDVLNAE